MQGRNLILSVTLLLAGVSCINAFLSPPLNQHLQLSSVRQSTRFFNPLPSQMNDNDDRKGVSPAAATDNFNAAGLGNYLAPYFLAFLASIGITGAFVKFVLMDY
jgi:hypothetical protein